MPPIPSSRRKGGSATTATGASGIAPHEPPEKEGGKVAAFLVAGALLARKDPVALGLVVKDDVGKNGAWKLKAPTRIKANVSHRSDHDWVFSDAAYAAAEAAVDRAIDRAVERANVSESERRWRKHEALAKTPGLTTYAGILERDAR